MASKAQKSVIIAPDRLKRGAMALEDFILTLRHVKAENLEVALLALQQLIRSDKADDSSNVALGYQSSDPNKHFLIGALPRLLLDRDLFPSNDDIIDFATAALKINFRAEKRSRFEIIGKIVCETDTLDERQLTGLVRALEKLVGDRQQLKAMVEKKRLGSFSWNETLQSLLDT